MKQIERALSSVDVAEMVGKKHHELLKDIRRYVAQINEVNIDLVEFFRDSTYTDRKGETRPCYQITKKGCEFIAHKLTGTKGTEFTAKYINKFHDMEEQIQNPLEGLSMELQSVIVVDKRVTKVEGRVEKLENNMTITHEQIQMIKNRINQVVVELLGGKRSEAYRDKSLRGKVYSKINTDYCNFFRINARANTLSLRFNEALRYIDVWRPDTNLRLQIKCCNAQMSVEVA